MIKPLRNVFNWNQVKLGTDVHEHENLGNMSNFLPWKVIIYCSYVIYQISKLRNGPQIRISGQEWQRDFLIFDASNNQATLTVPVMK